MKQIAEALADLKMNCPPALNEIVLRLSAAINAQAADLALKNDLALVLRDISELLPVFKPEIGLTDFKLKQWQKATRKVNVAIGRLDDSRAAAPAPFKWTETAAMTLLQSQSDGPFGQADVDDMLALLKVVEVMRANMQTELSLAQLDGRIELLEQRNAMLEREKADLLYSLGVVVGALDSALAGPEVCGTCNGRGLRDVAHGETAPCVRCGGAGIIKANSHGSMKP